MDEQKNIPLLDCPVDYLIGDASGKVMNEYGRFRARLSVACNAIIVRGSGEGDYQHHAVRV